MSPLQSTASSSSNIERENDELEQLRANLLTQSLQCAQLEEANRAWQQYHQSQLDIFRQALKDWIQCDDQSTLEQLAQHILIRLNQLGNSNEHDYPSGTAHSRSSEMRPSTVVILGTDATADSMQKQLTNYQLNESILAQNLEQLNQKLLDAYAQCEEFREHNAQLIASTQQLEQQSEERARQFLQLQETCDSLTLENQALRQRSNDMEQQLAQFSTSAMMKRVDSPREVCLGRLSSRVDIDCVFCRTSLFIISIANESKRFDSCEPISLRRRIIACNWRKRIGHGSSTSRVSSTSSDSNYKNRYRC